MRCPSCHQNIRVQGKFCPKCGEQIFGLPVRPAAPPEAGPAPFPGPPGVVAPAPPPPPFMVPPAAPPPDLFEADLDLENYGRSGGSEPVLEITLEDLPPPSGTADVVGKTCPYCRFPIKAGEAVQRCPSCGEPHHRDCWVENGGCTIYGCRSSPQMAAAAPVAAAPQPVAGFDFRHAAGLPREAIALLEAELDRLATNALVFALLGFLWLTAVIGLLTGISVLGQIAHSGLPARPARVKAWLAVGISLVWLLIFTGIAALMFGVMGGYA